MNKPPPIRKLRNRRPQPAFNRPGTVTAMPGLPISAKQAEIVQAIQDHKVVIISGETGSGKTTQIPKFCLMAGRGKKGAIACTQPRRIAAINVARRIAEELGQPLGESVGYKIRFDDKSGSRTCIKLMTDGILLAETQTDRMLRAYDTIIVDEAHERSLNIDFTLGILRQLVRKRKNLKLIITSATIDTEKFSNAFDQAPVIEVSGRTFPVETVYMPFMAPEDDNSAIDDQGYVEAACKAVSNLLRRGGQGDILIFMPTEQDIGETLDILRGQALSGVTMLPLFARLSAKEQSKIFSRQVGRKVIVSTNVAETSLTIPGIKYVVDTGLARIPTYSPRTRTTALPVSRISQSSANQRQGRCGRVENGVCIRLYDETDFLSRPFFTSPEILRSNLAEVILRMIALNLGDVSSFPFIDPPSAKSIQDGFSTLIELGAIKEKKGRPGQKKKKQYTLTRIGRIMAKLPMDPKLSRILIEADRKGCLKEATIIATALAISDPRQRPADKSQAADQQHAQFKDPASDFITLLNIWNAYQTAAGKLKSRGKLIRFCQAHFLSFKRMREWNEICQQITRVLKEHRITGLTPGPDQHGTQGLKSKDFEIGGPKYIAIHKSLLAGYLANIAHKKDKNRFAAAKGQQAMVFPGSGLFNTAGNWIVAAEFVKTSQLFARTCANIDPEWLEPIAKNLCTYTYSDPRWEKKQGRVIASEQVSLFGLILVSSRKVSYGKINPDDAAQIFIRHALVQAEIFQPFEFMKHNQSLMEELETLEHKRRKRDILISEEDIYRFYESRLDKPFYSIQTFSKFLKDQGSQDFLKMTMADLQKSSVDDAEIALYPDTLTMAQEKFTLGYEFKPGSEKDGVTIHVPASEAALVPEHRLDTLVPGLFEEKIAALIRALPKSYRVKLVPVSDTAKIIASQLPDQDRPLFSMLSTFIHQHFNVLIPASQWSDKDLPDHLKMRISIRDEKNREIKAVRDTTVLKEFSDQPARTKGDAFAIAQTKFEQTDLTAWDFKDLDEPVPIQAGDGIVQNGYPALVCEKSPDSGRSRVSLRLFRSEKKALHSHLKGVSALFQAAFQDDLNALRKDINRSARLKQAAPLFSGQGNFQASVFSLITQTLFEKNIQRKDEFTGLAEAQISRLYLTGQAFIKTITQVSDAYKDCFDTLQDLSFRFQDKPRTSAILTRLYNDLKNLIPANFTELYPYERILHLHRYAHAYRIRAQKAADQPLREEKKAGMLIPYQRQFEHLLSALSAKTSEEKTDRVTAFFWMLEEYKISLFAQEIKTDGKISAKKLDQELIALSAMI